jgi:hypothetical protein
LGKNSKKSIWEFLGSFEKLKFLNKKYDFFVLSIKIYKTML